MATMAMGDPLGIFRQSSSQSSAGFYTSFSQVNLELPEAGGSWRKIGGSSADVCANHPEVDDLGAPSIQQQQQQQQQQRWWWWWWWWW